MATKSSHKHDSFDQTMSRLRKHMRPRDQYNSKLIHSQPLDTFSELISNTIARPTSMFLGTLAAFVGTLLSYTLAHYHGFELSGSETIVSFAIGWTAGMIVDCAIFISHAFRHHK